MNGTNVKVYIKDNKTLVAFVTGQTDYELVPTAKEDEFDHSVANDDIVLLQLLCA